MMTAILPIELIEGMVDLAPWEAINGLLRTCQRLSRHVVDPCKFAVCRQARSHVETVLPNGLRHGATILDDSASTGRLRNACASYVLGVPTRWLAELESVSWRWAAGSTCTLLYSANLRTLIDGYRMIHFHKDHVIDDGLADDNDVRYDAPDLTTADHDVIVDWYYAQPWAGARTIAVAKCGQFPLDIFPEIGIGA